ncbi:MAG TPA: putative lipid II flippase FtsW [Rhodanobacteraceae bacterium]
MGMWFASSQAVRKVGPEGHHDPWLLLAITGLVSFGIVMVASSSIGVADGLHIGEFHYLKRHLLFLAVGGGIGTWIALRVELDTIERQSGRLLLITLALLLAVFIPHIGMRVNGARRWLNLGVAGFQPVELLKLTIVLYVASYLVRHRSSVETKFLGAVKPVLVAGFCAVLLLAQPDFGSASLIGVITIAMLWLGGARMRNLVVMAMPLLPLGAWLAMSSDYRVERLKSFLDPWKDPFTNGFQLTQALIAVGRGKWFGVGLGDSVQKLFYLPEAHTDFILAVIAEELGFVGVMFVLALFALLVGRGLQLGLRGVELGQQRAGYVAFGISMMLGLQSLISVGVNLGVLPTKGITLPLISSGGSSTLMTCIMLGVLLRAAYEIHQAEDARRMATRRSPPQTGTDRTSAELPLAARSRVEPGLGRARA